MASLGDIVQKAFFLGVGLAAYAGEQAGSKLSSLRLQAQKLVDEMVERGEMTTEEARRVVEELMNQAQQVPAAGQSSTASPEPRLIEILSEDETSDIPTQDVEGLRRQVLDLQKELQRLKQD
ncbi:MAG: hypothetical protein WCA35_08545 [Kovacikia sp.]